jgi:hypothetical protein
VLPEPQDSRTRKCVSFASRTGFLSIFLEREVKNLPACTEPYGPSTV